MYPRYFRKLSDLNCKSSSVLVEIIFTSNILSIMIIKLTPNFRWPIYWWILGLKFRPGYAMCSSNYHLIYRTTPSVQPTNICGIRVIWNMIHKSFIDVCHISMLSTDVNFWINYTKPRSVENPLI